MQVYREEKTKITTQNIHQALPQKICPTVQDFGEHWSFKLSLCANC